MKLTRRPRDNNQINKIRNKKGDITIDAEEIQRIIRSYFKNLYSTKMENLKETNYFHDRFHIPKLSQDQLNNINRPLTPKEKEAVIKVSQPQKAQGQMVSVQNSTKISNKR